jgi:uncharacterized protein (DUF488 family)
VKLACIPPLDVSFSHWCRPEPWRRHAVRCEEPAEFFSMSEDKESEAPPTVLTVGHSTRPIEEFVSLLKKHGVTCVVDVRTVPRSRRNPQFNRDTLPASLKAADIAYTHLAGLGGLRRPRPDSINTGWKNASFRGYADYMQTPEFGASLENLIELAKKQRVALMCAEAVPWRCHRSLIADALVARGIPTEHIMSESRRDAHAIRSFAKRKGIYVTYPSGDAETELF